MAILTRPVSFTKGTNNVFTLTVADLEAKVLALGGDAYYQASTNWRTVIVTYESSTGNQVNDIVFDIEGAVLTGDFDPSSLCRDVWTISYVTILDYDSGFYRINSADLTETPDFDDISFV